MIPILYDETEKDFQSNGIGSLVESLTAEVTEVLNGEYELYLEYSNHGQWAEEIREFRFISAKPNDEDDPHAFRIYDVIKRNDPDVIMVYATTKANDIGNYTIEKYDMTASPKTAMKYLSDNLDLPIALWSNIETTSALEWEYRSALNCIMGESGSLIQTIGGEVKRTNDWFSLYQKRGRDRVTTIRQDKNLDGFKQTVSTKGLVTKILPYYKYYADDGVNRDREPTTMTMGIVESPKVNDYPVSITRGVDFTPYQDEIEVTKEIKIGEFKNGKDQMAEVIDVAKTRINFEKKANEYFTSINPGVDIPNVTLEVDMYQLTDSPMYEKFKDLEKIGVGDTVDVWIDNFGIDVTVKVKRLVYDSLGETNVSLNAGSSSSSSYRAQKDEYTEALDDFKEYTGKGLDHYVNIAANETNRNWYGTQMPTQGMREGDIWFKQLPDGHSAIYIYDGAAWEFIIDTTDDFDMTAGEIEEALRSAQQVVDDVNQAITDAGFTSMKDLTEDIQSKSQQAFEDANKALDDIFKLEIGGRNLILDSDKNFVSVGTPTWRDVQHLTWREVT